MADFWICFLLTFAPIYTDTMMIIEDGNLTHSYCLRILNDNPLQVHRKIWNFSSRVGTIAHR